MPDQQASDMIADGMVADLITVFADVPDLELPLVIRGNKLQENPVKDRIYVLVHIGDPDEPDIWHDSSLAKRDQALDRVQFQAPAFEVGGHGTAMMYRRFTIEYGFYGTKFKESREEAQRQANLIKGRCEKALWRPTYAGVADLFGEIPLMAFVVQDIIDAGGGKNSFIWRGKIHVMVLTNRAL